MTFVPTASGGLPSGGTSGQVIGNTGTPGAGSWVTPAGFEIGYDQVTAPVSITSSTESAGTTLVSSSAYTFDGAAVIVEFFCPVMFTGSVVDVVTVSLFESTTQITRLAQIQNVTTAALGVPVLARYRFTPTAGSHTYTTSAIRSSSSNGSASAGSGGTAGYPPMYVRFTKV